MITNCGRTVEAPRRTTVPVKKPGSSKKSRATLQSTTKAIAQTYAVVRNGLAIEEGDVFRSFQYLPGVEDTAQGADLTVAMELTQNTQAEPHFIPQALPEQAAEVDSWLNDEAIDEETPANAPSQEATNATTSVSVGQRQAASETTQETMPLSSIDDSFLVSTMPIDPDDFINPEMIAADDEKYRDTACVSLPEIIRELVTWSSAIPSATEEQQNQIRSRVDKLKSEIYSFFCDKPKNNARSFEPASIMNTASPSLPPPHTSENLSDCATEFVFR